MDAATKVGGLLDVRVHAAVAALAAVNDARAEGDDRLHRRERLLHQLAMERQRRQRRLIRTA